jgi:sporulation protein YlmC with PRC-barrel domain
MTMKGCLSLCLTLGIVLAACSSPSQNSSPTNAPTAAPPTAAIAGGQATSAPTQATAAPATTGKPPQTKAADIRPPERRPELTRLSNLLKFQVLGLNNANLGKISDYIINTCETFVIYFVVDPPGDLKLPPGKGLVIPFEAVTINSGALDAQAKAIVVQLSADQMKVAPAFPNPLPLVPNDWEKPVRDYWQQVVRVGKLSSECNAVSGTVHKIAYATQLIGADLKDGNHNLLGSVQEIILEPESGQVSFYVVALQGNQGLVLVPLSKTNIPEEALKPGAKIELVLLADNKKLMGAPRISSLDQATDGTSQGAARQYWGK